MVFPVETSQLGAGDVKPVEPLVSIIVIGYNQRQFAPQAVASVLAQSHRNLECIFVDDGSSDGTFEAVAEMAQNDPRLRVFKKANRGPSAARNFGARHASEDALFIGFLDGDDEMAGGFVERLLSHLAANPATGVVVPANDYVDVGGNSIDRAPQRRWSPGWMGLFPRKLGDEEMATPFVTFYCGTGAKPFWLARREVYERTTGWNEGLWPFEDNEILAQFALLTQVDFLSLPLVRYRIHDSQITHHGKAKPRWYVDGGLERLQERFNTQSYGDHDTARTVDDACRYYRRVHLPLRHARVATKQLIEAIRKGSPELLASAAVLYWHFFRDFVQFRVLFWRARRTYSLLKH